MRNEIERAVDALFHIDAGCSRDEWVTTGMAAKSAGLGFDDFHNWSTSGSNYLNEKDCHATWKSFKNSGGITAATLFKIALDQGWKDTTYTKNNSVANKKINAKPIQQISDTQITNKHSVNADASKVWGLCVAADVADAYIFRKKGNPSGLRVYPNSAPVLSILGQNVGGFLVVPCLEDGVLQTLQFIPPLEGKKLNFPGASFNAGYFTVGKIDNTVYICEGIGTAWACAATGSAAVVCFGAGRMKVVAEAIRLQHPKCSLVLVPDKGKETPAESIAAAVNGSWVAMPADKPANYDANDYAVEYGAESLIKLLEKRQSPAMRFKLLTGDELCNAAPMEWLIRGLLPKHGLAALYGPSGAGKSFLMLDIACAIAGGHHE